MRDICFQLELPFLAILLPSVSIFPTLPISPIFSNSLMPSLLGFECCIQSCACCAKRLCFVKNDSVCCIYDLSKL